MACFCAKLKAKNYTAITISEAAALKCAIETAPRSFWRRIGLRKPLRRKERQNPQEIESDSEVDSALALQESYPCEAHSRLLEKNGPQLNTLRCELRGDIFVRIYTATRHCEHVQEFASLTKRIYCYALAKLYRRGTSKAEIIQRITSAVHDDYQTVKRKVYKWLNVGRQWVDIISQLDSVAKTNTEGDVEIPSLTGVVCAVAAVTPWERSSSRSRRIALENLYSNSAFRREVEQYNGIVNPMLGEILDEHSFVYCTGNPSIASPTVSTSTNRSISYSEDLFDGSQQANTARSSSSAATSWEEESQRTVSDLLAHKATESRLLLNLLCFLADSKFTLEFLLRGGSPRKRWTATGGIEGTPASDVGLASDLERVVFDPSKLSAAVLELRELHAIHENPDGSYNLDKTVKSRVIGGLSSQHHSFWRQQALIIAYRSLPWKYLETGGSGIRNIILPHMKYTLQATEDHSGYGEMPVPLKTDLALTLLEASRYPDMKWKRFAINHAILGAYNLEDGVVRCCIAQREAVVNRVLGNRDQATQAVEVILEDHGQDCNTLSRVLHAAVGQLILQRAFNYFQYEELGKALDVLHTWQPHDPISPLEETILFRLDILRGKILRYQGRFEDAQRCLKRSYHRAGLLDSLSFEEDMPDLLVELADTMIELNDASSAEQLLTTELAQQRVKASIAMVKLALAESLFAQDRFAEAQAFCQEIESLPNLSKMARLRMYILFAKLRHMESDWNNAFQCWVQAIKADTDFSPIRGHVTLAIYLSIGDVLRHEYSLAPIEWNDEATMQLRRITQNLEAKYWIAGLRQWLAHLQYPENGQVTD